MLHLHKCPSSSRATNYVLLLILIKRFKNLNLFEIFILPSNSFGTGHHWGMTDRWYNYISLLSLGSHIEKKTGKSIIAKIIMLLSGNWTEAERLDNFTETMQWSGPEAMFRVSLQNVKESFGWCLCALWVTDITESLATNNSKGCGFAVPDPILAQKKICFLAHFPLQLTSLGTFAVVQISTSAEAGRSISERDGLGKYPSPCVEFWRLGLLKSDAEVTVLHTPLLSKLLFQRCCVERRTPRSQPAHLDC